MIKKIIKSILVVVLPKAAYIKVRQIYSSMTNFFRYDAPVIIRRANILPFGKFKHLKKYRNLHKGERCFIVATGPSLTIDDVEKLKGEHTFSMNTIYHVFKDTAWRPTYYVIVDRKMYPLWSKDTNFKLSGIKEFFVGSGIEEDNMKAEAAFPYDYNALPDYCYRQFIEQVNDSRGFIPEPYKKKFSTNISAYVVVNNVAFVTLQIAVYMGFSEIYLLGCDCNFEIGKKNHIVDYDTSHLNLSQARVSAVFENLFLAYESAKKYADAHGIKIYNATRGGKLEVFERVNLDEVLTMEARGVENHVS